MITQITSIFYYFILGVFILSAFFIIFHIVRYSFNKFATTLMLSVFISVAAILILTNIILFQMIDFENLFYYF